MEKKQNSCPVEACEKFFKAIAVSSPFRSIRGMPAAATSTSIPISRPHRHTPVIHPRPAAGEVVPIRNGRVAATPVEPNPKMKPPISQFVEARKIATNHKATKGAAGCTRMGRNTIKTAAVGSIEEDEFSNYIKRAGAKIRTTSGVNGDRAKVSSSAGGVGEAGKDHFSDYIHRAKKRMLRTMSSFGGARSDSMKK